MKIHELITQIANEETGSPAHADQIGDEIEMQLTENGHYFHLDDPVDLDSAIAIVAAARTVLR